MPAAADDDVVVYRDPERFGGCHDFLGDGDIRLGRGRIARGVVVHQDQRRGAKLQGSLDHLTDVDRGVIDRAALLLFVGDQRVFAVEKKDVELLDLAVGNLGSAIIDQSGRTVSRKNRAVFWSKSPNHRA